MHPKFKTVILSIEVASPTPLCPKSVLLASEGFFPILPNEWGLILPRLQIWLLSSQLTWGLRGAHLLPSLPLLV